MYVKMIKRLVAMFILHAFCSPERAPVPEVHKLQSDDTF